MKRPELKTITIYTTYTILLHVGWYFDYRYLRSVVLIYNRILHVPNKHLALCTLFCFQPLRLA